MTSATGSSRRLESGLTLLEILIVMGIILMFTGYFFVQFSDNRSEELLSEAKLNLTTAALKAKKRSYTFRQDHFIRFNPVSFELADRPPGELSGFGPTGEEEGVAETFPLPSGVRMELMPPGEREWQKVRNYTWTFRDSGLSEPLKVRFSIDKSYTILSFNVLTGLAEEETVIY